MTHNLRTAAAAASALLMAISAGGAAFAQKPGGVLRIPVFDSPASMSIHEESAIAAERAMMGVFNNLVMFDQHVPQNSERSIVADLATGWSWSEDGTVLTLPLRQGVKWHDGKPFTAADVKCTWDILISKSSEKLRVNPRKSWYNNLGDVTTNGDHEVAFHLKRRQPSFITLLASGWSPVYPCHVSPRDMRSRPIGTGPFKFVEFKPNEVIRLARNPHYWKKDRPYLDAMEHVIIPSVSTRMLGFIAGKFDVITLQPPLLKDLKSQVPEAVCDLEPDNAARNLIVNQTAPPFDSPDLRRALTLSLDRKAFIEIITEGKGEIGGAMLPPPEGIWGMPPETLRTLSGYGLDVQKNREKGRQIMERLGYGSDKRLAIPLSARNRPVDRDPAVVLLAQLKEIYIDAELQLIETPQWYPKIMRKDYALGLTISENSLDDPDQTLYENYVCGAAHNYAGYCNPELDNLIDGQSMEADPERRKQLVWEIERKLVEDDVQPIIFYGRFATCWQPQVKGLTVMANSLFNGWRMEDVWLDK
jgi:peptide/nickel transport system substrate-binding protein